MLYWLSWQVLVESDRGCHCDLDTSFDVTSCDLAKSFIKSTFCNVDILFTQLIWPDGERRGDLEMSFTTTSSAEGSDSTRGICFTLGGVGSKPQNGSYNTKKTCISILQLWLSYYFLSNKDTAILLEKVALDGFNCLPVAEAISRRRRNILLKLSQSDNFLCHICRSFAHIELWSTILYIHAFSYWCAHYYIYLVKS